MASMMELRDEAALGEAIERRELAIVSALGLHPYPDGNMWCILWGNNLQDGVCGFGETPQLAVYDFNKKWLSGFHG